MFSDTRISARILQFVERTLLDSARRVSGHEFTRAERTLVRVNSIETSYFLSAEGRRVAPGVGAERLKE